jgi:putative spermidine/putrescine transport system substrate-binding protein
MKTRSLLGALAAIGLIVSACSGGATPSPAPTTAPASAASAAPSPSSNLPQSIGKAEGELNIIIWAGYAEDGSNKVPEGRQYVRRDGHAHAAGRRLRV